MKPRIRYAIDGSLEFLENGNGPTNRLTGIEREAILRYMIDIVKDTRGGSKEYFDKVLKILHARGKELEAYIEREELGDI